MADVSRAVLTGGGPGTEPAIGERVIVHGIYATIR